MLLWAGESAAQHRTRVVRRPRAQVLAGAVLLALGAAWPIPAFAHALRQRYDLPIPLGLYVAGAGATVVLSFVLIALLARRPPSVGSYPRINLLRFRVFRALTHPGLLFACRALCVGVFILLLLAGFFGTQNPFKNIAPTAVWVVWWVGLAYVSALVGDLWALINPWNTIFGWGEELHRRVEPGRQLSFNYNYPDWLGVWPSVLLFLAFAWAELMWEGAEVPARLASAALFYSFFTWGGMFLFGRERWLRSGEVFSVFFGTLARFAPMEYRSGDRVREWSLRPYGVGLLTAEPIHLSHMVFVLVMLSTVTFDGFIETPLWGEIVDHVLSARVLMPVLTIVHGVAGNLLPLIDTLGMMLFPLLFLVVYMAFAWLMALAATGASRGAGGQRFRTVEVARLFVFTLVPIAIAYHLAHYLSYLLVAGQFIIPLASDPFGFGWDLLGTTLYRIDIGIVDARFVWYTAVSAIVAGHIIAVCLAHLVALRVFKDSRVATRSQYPMLGLMVCYTMVSLWILAQPIVKTGGG